MAEAVLFPAQGQYEQRVQAMQLELSQCNYMDEAPPFAWCSEYAVQLQPVLKLLIKTLLAAGKPAAAAR